MDEVGEALSGGNMGPVTRFGDVVERVAGPWTPTVHRLLTHLRNRGVEGLPAPLSRTETHERLTHLPGTVPQYPLPDWVWDDSVLVAVAQRLATIHDASADFDRTDAVWQLPAHEPAEVICHNDLATYNLVFDDAHRLTGVIDWDTASPGSRVWDVAYTAYRFVPLTADTNPDTPAGGLDERRRRLDLMLTAYGRPLTRDEVLSTAVVRLRDLAAFTRARSAANPDVAPHVALYEADADWITAHHADLAG